jgi:hypothetical protein
MTCPPGSGDFVFFEQSNRKKDANFKICRATTPYAPLLWTLSYAPASNDIITSSQIINDS